MKIRFVMWDWKALIDIEWLDKALADVFNGKNLPSITVVDSGGDSYYIVVSSDPLTEEQAQKVYEKYNRRRDERNPCNKVLEIKWPQRGI